ncbi:related to LEO1 Extremely hydrophilic protein [Fusarium torulosum]|uniref:Related to LEO1 Extremely hydrophilic protein n=1 Tax=Fusarium torulosum TaxID=33205 RepID=A0AAE8M5A1_9HYPO|nr:related to LEO1 Extremely hydrophilic protein [Fusarium torulosum]
MSDSDEPIDQIDEGGDDLFGDDGDDDIVPTKEPVHEDDELASDPEGDSYARYRDRDDEDDQAQVQTKDRVVLNIKTYRHRIPKPKDGALRVLRIPKFLKIMPQEYNPDTFEPSEFDLENAKTEHPKHVARVRRDHSTDELKSNTNVFHWSDGSVTISVGGEHYEIQRKELAPPPEKPYNEAHDGHYYAAAAELHSNILMTVGHITEQYNVRPNKSVGDDALSILAEQIASASKPANATDMIIKTTRDPELQKKQAELAEKERMKAQRRRENAAAKMDGGYGRTAARGGLSIGDLEGGRRGAAGSRKRGAPGAGKPRRRRDEESDEELEDAVGRHEGYSLDDGFIVNSDDEAEESGADDDDEEELLDDDEDEKPRSKRQRTRDRSEDDEGSDVGVAGRARRRNVIDDDDD